MAINGMPAAAYDEVMANVTVPMRTAPGCMSHTAEVTADAITVTEVWESLEQWQTWFDASVRPQLPPGVPDPDITELHNTVAAG